METECTAEEESVRKPKNNGDGLVLKNQMAGSEMFSVKNVKNLLQLKVQA